MELPTSKKSNVVRDLPRLLKLIFLQSRFQSIETLEINQSWSIASYLRSSVVLSRSLILWSESIFLFQGLPRLATVIASNACQTLDEICL